MITQAYFEDIQRHIKRELEKAKSSIYIAVAWLMNIELFEILYRIKLNIVTPERSESINTLISN